MSALLQPGPAELPRKIKTTKVVYPQIYSYMLPEQAANEGSQKIGYTERRDVDKRIHEQTHTAAFQLKADKCWLLTSSVGKNLVIASEPLTILDRLKRR